MIGGCPSTQSHSNEKSKGNSMGLTLPIWKIPVLSGDEDDNSLLARKQGKMSLNDIPTGFQFKIDSPSMGPCRKSSHESSLSLASVSTASEASITYGRQNSLSLDSLYSDCSDSQNPSRRSSLVLEPLQRAKSIGLEPSTIVRTIDFGDEPAKTNVSEIRFFCDGESDGSEDAGESTDGDEEEKIEKAPIVQGKPRLPSRCFYDRHELPDSFAWGGDCTRRASQSNSAIFANSMDSLPRSSSTETNASNNSSSDTHPETVRSSSDASYFSLIALRKRNHKVSFSIEEPHILEYEQVIFTPTLASKKPQSESSSEASDLGSDDDDLDRFRFKLLPNGE